MVSKYFIRESERDYIVLDGKKVRSTEKIKEYDSPLHNNKSIC